MRLFEFDQPLARDTEAKLVSVLLTLRQKAIDQDDRDPIDVNSVIQMVNNLQVGGNVDRGTLKLASEKSPQIKSLVRSINDGKIVFNFTDGDDEQTVSNPPDVSPEQQVGMMAQRAMSRRQ
jgi:hypothetical protein